MQILNRLLYTLLLLCLGGNLWAQGNTYANDYRLLLKTGPRTMEANADDSEWKDVYLTERFGNYYYRYLQFDAMPTAAVHQQLEALGVELLDYIPHKTYVAAIPVSQSWSALQQLPIRSVQRIAAAEKIDASLDGRGQEQVEVLLYYYGNIDDAPVLTALESAGLGIEVMEKDLYTNTLQIELPADRLQQLAQLPFIQYLEWAPPLGQPESDDGRNLHRSNLVDSDYFTGRHYDGTGVAVAVNDDGFVGPHIDFKGRTEQSDVAGDMTGSHGDMVAGILGGAGNLDPLMRGMAPGAFLWIRQYSGNLPNTVQLHTQDDVMIFSSSYSNGCNAGYTTLARTVDQQIFQYPSLIQVFSGGNSNNNNCGYGAGTQWGNITGGHKVAKNVIATANLDRNDQLRNSSSRGPASDGRLKPEISAHGHNQVSTDPNNAYSPGGGTSAAAPGISGVLAQLYQAYRELNSNANPPSGLLKAALLNSANDLGNPGPDYSFGFGKVNAFKALTTIEDNRYLTSSVAQGATNSHTITVPANTEELRVMLYWTDPQGSTNAAIALVNDLDATLTDPSANTFQPWVLDPTPNAANLAAPATRMRDSLNNVEQITIQNPAAGTYTLNVAGTVIPFATQEYFVVYEFNTTDVMVVHPAGGEGFEPGESLRIHWDAIGDNQPFALDYSLDGGNNWTSIANNIGGGARFFDWTAPNTITGGGLIRVTRNGQSDQSDTTFNILGIPDNIQVTNICSNAIRITWDSVPNADSYVIYLLGNRYMDSVGISTTTTFDVPTSNPNGENWVAVAARKPGVKGRRSIAVSTLGQSGQPLCLLDCVSSDDAGLESIESPLELQQNCTGAPIPVSVVLTNIGPNTQSNFPVYYQVGNGTIQTQNFTGTLPGNDTAHFTFNTGAAFVTGSNTLRVWTDLPNDGTVCNDTLTRVVDYADMNSTYPIEQDFENGLTTPLTYVENPDDDFTWFRTTAVGSDGSNTSAVRVNNFSYNAPGEKDIYGIFTTDLDGAVAAQLSFDVAYTPYSASLFDGLLVLASDDCGATFNDTLYFKEGTTLATVPTSTAAFEPTQASDWRNEVIDLTDYLGGNLAVQIININGYGNRLWIDNINLNVINSAPAVNFDANILATCVNEAVTMQDLSTNNPTNWQWSFTPNTVSYVNGTNANSQNPEVRFDAAGYYTVSLQATNAVGSATETKTAYIHAAATAGLNVAEDFEAATFPPMGWVVENTDSDETWKETTVSVGVDGTPTKATFVENFIYNNRGAEDYLYTMPVSVTGQARLSFDVAHANYSANSADELRIDVSTDCGNTFSTLAFYDGQSLSTVSGNVTSNWEPTSVNEWREENISLSNFAGSTILLRFVNINDYGNNTYLDNVNIEDVTGVQELGLQAAGLQVFPNPNDGRFTLAWANWQSNDVHAELFNVQGQRLNSYHWGVVQPYGQKELQLQHLPAGMYFLRIRSEAGTETLKVSIR